MANADVAHDTSPSAVKTPSGRPMWRPAGARFGRLIALVLIVVSFGLNVRTALDLRLDRPPSWTMAWVPAALAEETTDMRTTVEQGLTHLEERFHPGDAVLRAGEADRRQRGERDEDENERLEPITPQPHDQAGSVTNQIVGTTSTAHG